MAMSIVPKTLCQLSMAITIPQKLSIPMVVNTIAHVWWAEHKENLNFLSLTSSHTKIPWKMD